MAKDKKQTKDSKNKKSEASINNGNKAEHNEKKLEKEPVIVTKKDEKKLVNKLSEQSDFKNITKKKKKDRKPVWVKNFTLYYEKELRQLQIELLKMQKHVKKEGLRIMMIFEGRDAAGKGGTLKRITEHLNPRGTRVVALLTPSDKERTEWYFQRYIQHLPSAGEIVLFDRSWYNRAMVEPVMEFCSDEQNKRFLKDVPMLEEMLVKNGIFLFKFFFSVSKNEQLRRFNSRETDPLKHYKISQVDKMAQGLWDDYSIRKFQMLNETNRTISPWTIIRSDNKKLARLNCIKHILSKIDYKDRIPLKELKTDPGIVVSGIDEIRFMEDHLMEPDKLPG